jgi:hypothetical protein
LGWTGVNGGSKVGIGFNSDQSGGTGITLDTLVLTIFNGTTALGSFSLASAITFSVADLALQQGNGNAVFNFALTPTEQVQFNTLLAMAGSSSFRAGLSSSLGCGASPPPGCLPSNDGPDSFVGFAQAGQPVVPLPGALPLFVTGLVGLGLLARRKRKAQAIA